MKYLEKQNITFSIIQWIVSFFKNGKVAVCLDGETDIQEPVKIGVLQGFPISPIFLMLFTTPIIKIFTKEDKNAEIKICGYIDNGLLTMRVLKKDIKIN